MNFINKVNAKDLVEFIGNKLIEALDIRFITENDVSNWIFTAMLGRFEEQDICVYNEYRRRHGLCEIWENSSENLNVILEGLSPSEILEISEEYYRSEYPFFEFEWNNTNSLYSYTYEQVYEMMYNDLDFVTEYVENKFGTLFPHTILDYIKSK